MVEVVSLRQAGKELNVDPKVVKGMAIGMGIKLTPLSRSLFISSHDFRRLKRRLESAKEESVACIS